MTKLYNKRALDEFLHVKEGEFERYGRSYCVIMFDLDNFKKVNDTYGHEAGDAVLAGFAKVFKNLSRDVDIVGRYGGEGVEHGPFYPVPDRRPDLVEEPLLARFVRRPAGTAHEHQGRRTR